MTIYISEVRGRDRRARPTDRGLFGTSGPGGGGGITLGNLLLEDSTSGTPSIMCLETGSPNFVQLESV